MSLHWILGSGSPRRRELLKELNISYEIVRPDVEEIDHEYYDPKELVLHNARLKQDKIKKEYPDSCILCADTTVALGDRIFNKPSDLDHAFQMLSLLVGKTHSVFTGVVFCHGSVYWEFVEETKVTFKVLDDSSIRDYLSKIEPLDKAGGYAVQEFGDLIISRYEGSYTNIVGLPLETLAAKLVETGYLPEAN